MCVCVCVPDDRLLLWTVLASRSYRFVHLNNEQYCKWCTLQCSIQSPTLLTFFQNATLLQGKSVNIISLTTINKAWPFTASFSLTQKKPLSIMCTSLTPISTQIGKWMWTVWAAIHLRPYVNYGCHCTDVFDETHSCWTALIRDPRYQISPKSVKTYGNYGA
jgi:hypothetical protein